MACSLFRFLRFRDDVNCRAQVGLLLLLLLLLLHVKFNTMRRPSLLPVFSADGSGRNETSFPLQFVHFG